MCTKGVIPLMPGSQQRPILLRVTSVAKARDTPFQRRYNFAKSNWDFVSEDFNRTSPLIRLSRNMKNLEFVCRASNRNFPRGCGTKLIPGTDDSAKDLLNAYNRECNLDPFSEKTVELRHELLQSIGSSRQQQGLEMIDATLTRSIARGRPGYKSVDLTATPQWTQDKLKSLQTRLQVVSLPTASLREKNSDNRDAPVLTLVLSAGASRSTNLKNRKKNWKKENLGNRRTFQRTEYSFWTCYPELVATVLLQLLRTVPSTCCCNKQK